MDATVDGQKCGLSIGWTGNDENMMGARYSSGMVVSMHVVVEKAWMAR